MRFPPTFIEEIKARLPVSEVVRRRVKLQKAGREWRGLSPFSSEKTPSFFVNDQKQAWFDFSAGRNGSIFDFVMATEGVSFPEAVERLAALAGLDLPEVSPEAEAREKVRAGLQETLELATKFFEEQLHGRAGARARGYLADRGVVAAEQQAFRLGFAPAEKFALRDALAAKGASAETMIEAGLLIHGEDIAVPYDRFRDRVMFPIADRGGRTIAFGGRAMDPNAPAKYLNSPETPLFHKGAQLYNLHRARKPAHERGRAIAVEGYMDVIAMTRAGYGETVAPLGTALTAEQCALLWRLAPEPILCFDGDRAGRKAAYRAADVALPLIAADRSFRFALLPEGQDPDDLVRKGGTGELAEALDAAKPLVDLVWSREVEAEPLDTPERRAGLERRLAEALRPIGDETLRRHYRAEIDRRLATLFGAPPATPAGRAPRRNGSGGRSSASGRRFGRDFNAPAGLGFAAAPLALGPSTAESALLQRRPAAPPREALIVLLAQNHPGLLDRHAEELAGLELAGEDTRRLRDALVRFAHDGMTAADLAIALDADGLGPVRQRIESRVGRADLWGVRPEAAEFDAEAMLRQALTLHRNVESLHRELKLAEAAFAAELSEESWARLREIQVELSSLEGTEAAIEGFGAASGRGGEAV